MLLMSKSDLTGMAYLSNGIQCVCYDSLAIHWPTLSPTKIAATDSSQGRRGVQWAFQKAHTISLHLFSPP